MYLFHFNRNKESFPIISFSLDFYLMKCVCLWNFRVEELPSLRMDVFKGSLLLRYFGGTIYFYIYYNCTFGCCYLRWGQRFPAGPEGPFQPSAVARKRMAVGPLNFLVHQMTLIQICWTQQFYSWYQTVSAGWVCVLHISHNYRRSKKPSHHLV